MLAPSWPRDVVSLPVGAIEASQRRAHSFDRQELPVGFKSPAAGGLRNRSCAAVRARAADRYSYSGIGAKIMEDRHQWS
jgi:hypothetical protein